MLCTKIALKQSQQLVAWHPTHALAKHKARQQPQQSQQRDTIFNCWSAKWHCFPSCCTGSLRCHRLKAAEKNRPQQQAPRQVFTL